MAACTQQQLDELAQLVSPQEVAIVCSTYNVNGLGAQGAVLKYLLQQKQNEWNSQSESNFLLTSAYLVFLM
jgi:hypothetical protein